MAYNFLVLNGPNLNLLGEREAPVYGVESLDSILDDLRQYAEERGCKLLSMQSNGEGDLITAIHGARAWANGIILNAGAYTHTSIAIRDAIAAVRVPVVEVHLSNVYAREEFRHTSVLAPVCLGVIAGFGRWSYFLGIDALVRYLEKGE